MGQSSRIETKQPCQVVSATMQVCDAFRFTHDRTRIATHTALEICGYIGNPFRESLKHLLGFDREMSGLGIRRSAKGFEYTPGANVFSIRGISMVEGACQRTFRVLVR